MIDKHFSTITLAASIAAIIKDNVDDSELVTLGGLMSDVVLKIHWPVGNIDKSGEADANRIWAEFDRLCVIVGTAALLRGINIRKTKYISPETFFAF